MKSLLNNNISWLHMKQGWLLVMIVMMSCIDEDYKPFDTAPAITAVTPKLRILNINFQEKSITIKLGGKVFADKLVHRKITSYTDTSKDLLGDSVLQVYNGEGVLLHEEKLRIQTGSHYTIAIVPAYERAKKTTGNTSRWLFKVKHNGALAVTIADPLQAPLSDRTSVRNVALAIDQAQYFSRYSTSQLPIYGVAFTDYPWPGHGLQVTDDYLPDPAFRLVNSQPLTLPLSAWPPSRGYDVDDPPRYQVGNYFSISPKESRLFSTAAYSTSGEAIGIPPSLMTPMISFKGGSSYTVITNGTLGVLNDASLLMEDQSPVPLQSIPFEMYVLDDQDYSERILTPQSQYDLKQLVSTFAVVHLNPYDNDIITYSLDGIVERAAFLVQYGGAGLSVLESPVEGQHRAGVLKNGTIMPIKAVAEVNYKRGLYYGHYYYADQDGSPQLKVQEIDTVYKQNTLRLSVVHLVSGLEPLKILNAITGETLIASVEISQASSYVELPIQYSDVNGSLSKQVDLIRVVRRDTDELLFDINLSPERIEGGNQMLIDNFRNSKGSMPIFSLLLFGDINQVNKQVVGLVKTVPESTSDVSQVGFTTFTDAFIF